jgi:sec-independent protein translocase protein TatA
MFDLGGGELLLIVLAVLVLFGPKKLPELAQSLGRGMREFRRAQREFAEQINMAVHDDEQRKQGSLGRQFPGLNPQIPDNTVSRGKRPGAPPATTQNNSQENAAPPIASEKGPTVSASDENA